MAKNKIDKNKTTYNTKHRKLSDSESLIEAINGAWLASHEFVGGNV